MFGIRTLRAVVTEIVPGRWCPAADESTITFRPMPWELGRYGWLNERALHAIGRAAGRSWMSVAGPRVPGGRIEHKSVGEVQATGGWRLFQRLTVRTWLAGYEGDDCLLSHVIECANGRRVTQLISRVALSQQAEWSAFPPYAARAEA